MAEVYDYVIAGAGIVGCVVASRLSQAGHSVALIEAGPEDYNDMTMSPLSAPLLHDTQYVFKIPTTRQAGLGGRAVINLAGRLVSGSSGVNYGLWTRGHSIDYDVWAKIAGDDRWSYKSLVKYFMKAEKHHDVQADKAVHGFEGPMLTTAGTRTYPLRELVRMAMIESGLSFNPDANGGNPFGFGVFTENWKDAKRQPAGLIYDLSEVTLLTNSTVAQVDFDANKTATGLILATGQTITARKEVILSCGALNTPKLLMLSGIGPAQELSKQKITPIADLPVGQNLHDHGAVILYWKLKHPERNLVVPLLQDPSLAAGFPIEWLATLPTPADSLATAAKADGIDKNDPYIASGIRGNIETFAAYAPLAGAGANFRPPVDGSVISTPAVLLLSTSRGTVTLADTDPTSYPLIDPNYLATATDRAALRAGMRQNLQMMESKAGREIAAGELPPPGFAPLTSESSDEELDARLTHGVDSFYQYGGTAAMGKVVDSECRVMGGVKGLRVLDASVLPVPLAAHYMAPMYAFGEAAADMMLGK